MDNYISAMPYDIILTISKNLLIDSILSLNELLNIELPYNGIINVYNKQQFDEMSPTYHPNCNIAYVVDEEDNLESYSNVNSLVLGRNAKNADALVNVEAIRYLGSRIRDFSKLDKLKKLYMAHNQRSDIKYNVNIQILDVCRISNYNRLFLKNLISLTINLEFSITDLNELVNLTYLDCCYCYNLRDISKLLKLNTLKCSMTQIIDISMLINLQYLQCIFSSINDLRGLDNLISVHCHIAFIKYGLDELKRRNVIIHKYQSNEIDHEFNDEGPERD